MTQRTLREQIAAGQERLITIREVHRDRELQAERFRKMHRKTPYRDKVPKVHDTKPLKESLDALYESAAEALDEVTKASERSKKVEQATRDRVAGRFPGIDGGGPR